MLTFIIVKRGWIFFVKALFWYFNSWIKVIELKAIQRNQKQLRLKPNSPFHQRNCPSSYSEILHFSSSELWKIKYKSWILNSQKKYFIGVFLKSLPNENEPECWVLLPMKMLWKPLLQPIKSASKYQPKIECELHHCHCKVVAIKVITLEPQQVSKLAMIDLESDENSLWV